MGALSISHANAAGYTVIATCSTHNFEFVKARGASHVFDYNNEEETLKAIRELGTIDHIYDCVSLPSSISALIKLFSSSWGMEKKEVTIYTLTPPSMYGNPTLPEGLNAKLVLFRSSAPENTELVEWMLKKGGYLETGLKDGWLRGVDGESIGGLESVAKGLERRRVVGLKGVSARRLIVEPWL